VSVNGRSAAFDPLEVLEVFEEAAVCVTAADEYDENKNDRTSKPGNSRAALTNTGTFLRRGFIMS
jgi:hypothetical protein